MILYWLYVEIIVAWIDGVKENVLKFSEETKPFWKMKSGKQNDKWWQSNDENEEAMGTGSGVNSDSYSIYN